MISDGQDPPGGDADRGKDTKFAGMARRHLPRLAGSGPTFLPALRTNGAFRRGQLGLSHEELAARAGVSVPYLTYLDTYPADVTMSYLMRLPNALEMSPAAALGVDCRRRLASAARRAPF